MSHGTVININVSLDGVQDALDEINDYKSWLLGKMEELRDNVAEIICDNADGIFSVAVADDTYAVEGSTHGVAEPDTPRIGGDVTVTIESDTDDSKLVVARGPDAVWMEFGAGVYNNTPVGTSPHPMAGKFGYSIGTYGKGYGANDSWVFVSGDRWHRTHGTPASMPMYTSMMEAWDNIDTIARDVFQG